MVERHREEQSRGFRRFKYVSRGSSMLPWTKFLDGLELI